MKSAANQSALASLSDRVKAVEERVVSLEERLRATEGSAQKASLATTRQHSLLK